jgi:hypothetical protein
MGIDGARAERVLIVSASCAIDREQFFREKQDPGGYGMHRTLCVEYA